MLWGITGIEELVEYSHQCNLFLAPIGGTLPMGRGEGKCAPAMLLGTCLYDTHDEGQLALLVNMEQCLLGHHLELKG